MVRKMSVFMAFVLALVMALCPMGAMADEAQPVDVVDALGRTGYSYALGVRVLTDPSTSRGPAGEFGWDSAAAAWVMLDPDHHFCALFTPHVLDCGRAYVEYHPAMRDLIYEGMAR